MKYIAIACLATWIGTVAAESGASGQEQPIPLPSPVSTTKPASLTFNELRQGVKKRYKELWALEVEYELIPHGGPSPPGKVHFALQGEKRLNVQTWESHKPYGQACDGEVWEVYGHDGPLPNSSAAFIDQASKKEQWVDIDGFAYALGIPVSDVERANVAWQPNLLPSALDIDRLGWTVQPTLDQVDGADCHVLACKTARLWIDPALGFAMRFREERWNSRDLQEAEPPLAGRYFFSQFERTKTGTHMPKKLQVARYPAPTSPRSMWNQAIASLDYRVEKIALATEVEDSLFRFKFAPGTFVSDRVNNHHYRVGNSGEELSFLIGAGKADLRAKPFASTRIWLLILNAGAIVIIAPLFIYQILRRRHSTR